MNVIGLKDLSIIKEHVSIAQRYSLPLKMEQKQAAYVPKDTNGKSTNVFVIRVPTLFYQDLHASTALKCLDP